MAALSLALAAALAVCPRGAPARHSARASATRANVLLKEPTDALSRLKRLEAELDAAVREERYGVAASLRDELSSLKVNTGLAIVSANADFYRFFSSQDIKSMENLWLDVPEVVCIHPGHPPIHGFAPIMSSWRQIFEGDPLEVRAESVRCRVRGGVGYVTCFEVIGGNQLVATNIFEEKDGSWKLVLHQAGPCMTDEDFRSSVL